MNLGNIKITGICIINLRRLRSHTIYKKIIGFKDNLKLLSKIVNMVTGENNDKTSIINHISLVLKKEILFILLMLSMTTCQILEKKN